MAVVLAVCVVVAVGSLAAGATHHVPGVGAGEGGPAAEETDDVDATGTPTPTVAPGAKFVGAIGVHRERHAGEIDAETVEVRLARAGSERARAEVVADVSDAKRDRFDDLLERTRELERARDNGTISESEYLARRAALDVQFRSVARVAGRLEVAADGLSAAVLLEVDVDLESIRALEADARDRQSGALGRIAPSFDPETDAGTNTSVDGGTNVSVGASDG